MTFSIGRAGTDVVLDNPSAVSTQGNRVVFSQNAQTCANLTDMRALQQQIAGMEGNTDEPVIPVIWSDNAYFTGFYRVTNVDVGSYPAGYSSFVFPWRVELEPTWRYGVGSFEQVSTISTRTGAAALLAATGLPVSAFGVTVRSGTLTSGGSAYATRTGADGTVPVLCAVAGSQRTLIGYGSTPANHYLGSCYLKVGANTRYAVGQQVESETAWEIGNSLVKVSGTGSNSQINVQHYSGSYRSKPYKLQANGSDLPAASSIAVLRNSPECVIFRTYHTITGSPNQASVTYMLRRGSIILECTMAHAPVTGYGITAFKVVCATTEAGTSGTSSSLTYVQATAADGAGDKYTLIAGTQPAGSGALTADTANGGLNLANPVSYFAFGVTANMGGTAGSTTVLGESIGSLAVQYGAAVNQIQIPVS